MGEVIVITSGKDINILASEINSGNLLLADAKNNLNIMSDEEIFKQEEIHKKTSFSPSISGNMLVLAQEKTTSDKNAIIKQVSSNKRRSSSDTALDHMLDSWPDIQDDLPF